MIAQWNRQVTKDIADDSFSNGSKRKEVGEAQIVDYKTLFFGQGIRSLSHERRKEMVESNHSQGLSIACRWELLGISRSSFYYMAK